MPRDLFADQEERQKSGPRDLFAERGIKPAAPAEPEGSDLVRGFTSYLPQLKETLGGAQVLAGKVFGSEDVMKAGLERMRAAKEELSVKHKETDSFTKALDKGIGTVLTDWLPYQIGSGAANLVESLAVMGAGMVAGSAVPGLGTATGGVTGLLEKELVKRGVKEAAEKIAKESGEEAAKKFFEDRTKEATKVVAKKVAGTTALAAQAGFHGAGETTSRAIEEAERLGKEATDIDLERVIPATIVHGTAEFIGDKIGLGAFNKLDGGSKNLLLNFSKNLLTTGTKEAPVEVVQSMAERFGAKLSLTDAEAVKEYIDSAAAAYAMSVVPSAGGAVRQTGEAKLAEDVERQQELAKQEQESAEAVAVKATEKAEEEAAKISETAVPDETGEIKLPTFTPLQIGEQSGEQLTGVDTGAGQPSVTSAVSELESAAEGAGAPVAARVEPAAGAAEPSVTREADQPAALSEVEQPAALSELEEQELTPEIELTAQQLYNQRRDEQIQLGVPPTAIMEWEETSDVTKQEFYNEAYTVLTGQEAQDAESTTIEPAAVEPVIDLGQPISETEEGPAAEPAFEDVSATPTEVLEEQAPPEAGQIVEEGEKKGPTKADYAATEGVFSKEQMPFVAAKAPYRVKTPLSLEEASDFAAIESGFDMFESAEQAVNQQLREQAKEQGVTRDKLMAAMPKQQLFKMYEDNANFNNLDGKRPSQAQARENFINSLPEEQQKIIREKAIKALHSEVTTKLEGRITTEADKRKARQKTYDEAAAKRAKRKEQKATAEVKETKKEIKKLETTEKKKTPVEIREEKVMKALKSGSGFEVASAIAAGYQPNKSLTVDNISQVFAQRLAKLMSAFDHEPEIVIGKVEGNRPGKYDPETETITIDPNAPRDVPLEAVILHELTHYAVDRMIDNYSVLTPEQKQNVRELEKLHKHVQSLLGDKYAIPTLKEFAAEAFSNTKFQMAMANLPPMNNKSILTMFAQRVMEMLGFRSREANVFGDVVTNIEQLMFGPRRGEAKEISYAPKPVGPVEDRSFNEMVEEMKSDKPVAFASKAKEIAMTGKGREALIRVLQNDRIRAERWQDSLMAQGRIIAYGLGFNNIYDQITLATGNADYLYKHKIQNIVQDIYRDISAYANEYGISTDRALKEIGQMAIAKHHDERRVVLYLKTVPLSDAKILQDDQGTAISPSEARDAIFKLLDTTKLNNKQTKQLRDSLESLVFDPQQRFLEGKNPSLLDINNTKYDVAGAYTNNEIAAIIREYEARRPAVDKVLNNIKKLNKTNIELNREANYVSEFADNWISFYGWENYVPLKGKALSEEAQLLDLDSRKLGGELQDTQYSMEGRVTPPDNPILQVMSDSALAAMRAGRKGVTEAIYNAREQGLIKGKVKVLDFYERNNIKKLEEYRGESAIFHYMPNGKVAVIKLEDQALREAIRRTYREAEPLIDRLNGLTSRLGQLHTRYNVSFAPVNFVRDVLTNAYTLGADLGPGATIQYLGAIASGIVRQQYKAGVFAWHYANGNTKKIEELVAKDRSGYYKDMLEYVKIGGKVSYMAGISPKGQYSEFMKASGGGKIITGKAQINKLFDMWIDSFELTARVAAYRISKSTEKAKLINEGVSEIDAEQGAKVTAAAYTKNLANFEQIGELGKVLGAFFMFFRPSATGAVRAFKAVSPAFMNVQDAKTRLPEYAEMLNLKQKLKEEKYEGKKKEDVEKRLAELQKGLDKFEATYEQRKQSARVMVAALMGMGYMVYLMSKSMADDDDLGRNKVSTDDMARWTRFARFFIPGSDIIIQIPWGFGLGAFAAFGAQLASLGDSNTNLSDTLGNMLIVSLDSFIPLPVSRISPLDHPLQFTLDSIMPSIGRPLLEMGMNMDGLGRQIYNNRQSRFGEAYTGGDNVPELYKLAARTWFDETNMDVGPGVLYFLANNYADGVSRIMHNSYNTALWLSGDKEFNAKTDLMVLDSFVGSKSNFDARQWQKIEDDLKERQKIVNMLKDNKPVQYAEYLAAHPLDQMLVDMYNKDVNGYLRDLRADANKYRAMDGLSPKDRKAIVDSIVMQQNLEKYRLVQLYKAMGVEP